MNGQRCINNISLTTPKRTVAMLVSDGVGLGQRMLPEKKRDLLQGLKEVKTIINVYTQ